MDPRVDGKLVVMLIDFGLAYQYSPESPPTNKCGTIIGLAPEMLTAKSYCHKVDVWGLGIILHELLTTQLPFYAEDVRKYKYNIVNEKLNMEDADIWECVSCDAKDLVAWLLDKNPVTRPSISEALKHSWFNEFTMKVKN